MQKFIEKVFPIDGILKEMLLNSNNHIVIDTYLLGLDSSGNRVLVESKQFNFLDIDVLNYFNNGN